jgi:hypothetical protein
MPVIRARQKIMMVTMKQYVQTYLEADREVANTLADLIIGGLLVTEDTAIDDQADPPDRADET